LPAAEASLDEDARAVADVDRDRRGEEVGPTQTSAAP